MFSDNGDKSDDRFLSQQSEIFRRCYDLLLVECISVFSAALKLGSSDARDNIRNSTARALSRDKLPLQAKADRMASFAHWPAKNGGERQPRVLCSIVITYGVSRNEHHLCTKKRSTMRRFVKISRLTRCVWNDTNLFLAFFHNKSLFA